MHHPFDLDDPEMALAQAADWLRQAQYVAVMTGAGVSAESGVATFRGPEGLWEGHRVEEVATPEAFHADPKMVWRFYNLRRAKLREVEPNPGHYALVDLEQRWQEHFALISQNVDGLHRRAGSQRLYELHGNLTRTRCTQCGQRQDQGLDPLPDLPHCPKCDGLLRPDVVWFHESLPEDVIRAAAASIDACDCLLVVGTSAVVYPAAGFIPLARKKEPPATIIEINPNHTEASHLADVRLQAPSGEILPKLVHRIEAIA